MHVSRLPAAFGSTFLLRLCVMLVGVWLGLYWVIAIVLFLRSIDHYVQSSGAAAAAGLAVPDTRTPGQPRPALRAYAMPSFPVPPITLLT